MAELFKPPPPPPRETVSKKRKAAEVATEENTGIEEGVEGASKKKKKREKDVATNPDDPNAPPSKATPKPKKPRASKKKAAANETNADGPQDPLLNLSPTEAARRRDEANRKLTEAGIDPATLTPEQFDIFSNQSPDLQKESLAMLVKYGAERLRIVHPTKDTNTASSSTTAAANNTPSTPNGSTKKKKSKKKTLNEDGTPKVKRTRGKCQGCTAKKVKVRYDIEGHLG